MMDDMIAVIIAGGSGSRLWPISTPAYPKHLLKIASDKSLLRNTYERAKKLTQDIYIVSDISHAHHVKDQLSEIDAQHLIIEPGRRGTANCIVTALEHVARNHDETEPIIFLSADHHIRDIRGFIHSFKVATRVSQKENKIVLVGVEPDHPATGFGYIQKDGVFDEENFVFNVDSFKEKPDYDTAQKYVQSGEYLWNCGYFVGSVKTFMDEMEEHNPNLLKSFRKLSEAKTQKEYSTHYLSLKNDTIDYALIEKVQDLLVVPASFDWMDLGSYADIHRAVEKDKTSNHITGIAGVESVENAYIHNEEEKPIAVIGLDNIVVVNTKDGILIARKDQSQKVKDVVKKIEEGSK
jgi:mannose-1-phosphate guanylyltransferase/mannose-6-phosphate isomerase